MLRFFVTGVKKPALCGLWGEGGLVGRLAPEGQYQHYRHPNDGLHHEGSNIRS